jgi:hypothetical protein
LPVHMSPVAKRHERSPPEVQAHIHRSGGPDVALERDNLSVMIGSNILSGFRRQHGKAREDWDAWLDLGRPKPSCSAPFQQVRTNRK